MELLCVNNKPIILGGINYTGRGEGNGGLVEDKIYETKGEPYLNENGHECYYITGKGLFLAIRFTKALPKEVEYLYTTIKTEEPVLN